MTLMVIYNNYNTQEALHNGGARVHQDIAALHFCGVKLKIGGTCPHQIVYEKHPSYTSWKTQCCSFECNSLAVK